MACLSDRTLAPLRHYPCAIALAPSHRGNCPPRDPTTPLGATPVHDAYASKDPVWHNGPMKLYFVGYGPIPFLLWAYNFFVFVLAINK